MLTVIACYSFGTPYEAEAEILRRSLNHVGMTRHYIEGFADLGSWTANTAYKAEVIQQLRWDLPGALLYVDVDAFVHADCTEYFEGLAKEGCDFGVHWFADPAGNRSTICACVRGGACSQEHRLLSGTLFFGDTEGARLLVDAWVGRNIRLREQGVQEGGGQKNLWRTVTAMGDQIKQARLPGRYCRVFDKPWAYPADEPSIIVHSIASRENRLPSDRIRPRVNGARREQIAKWKRAVGL